MRGVDVEVAMEFDNIETIKRAIEIGAGLGILPEPTVTREVDAGTLMAVPLTTQELIRPLGIIHRRGKQLSGTARRFLESLLKQEGDVAIHADEPPAAPEENGDGRIGGDSPRTAKALEPEAVGAAGNAD
jgi:hypothetical protein